MKKCGVACLTKDLGLLLIRLVLATVFIYHGGGKVFGWFHGNGMFGPDGFIALIQSKGMPMPVAAAWAAALSELVGGVLIGIGLLTRLAAIPMAFTMGVAVMQVHWGKFSGPGGLEFALTCGVVLLGLILTGPGHLSIDCCLWSRCCRRGTETPPGGP